MEPQTNPIPIQRAVSNRPNPALLVFLIFPLVALFAAVSIGGERTKSGANGLLYPPPIVYTPETLIGKLAPDFTLNTPDGKAVRLSSLRGQIVFLNFWATYCVPCEKEMPVFQALTDGKVPGKAIVLAVNQGDTRVQINDYYAAHTLSVPTVMDVDGKAHDLYQVPNLPHTFVIDAQGIVQAHVIGPMTDKSLAAYIKSLGGVAG